eukprot:g5799.t2
MKLLSACFGGFLVSMPVGVEGAKKMLYDYRPDGDFGTQKANCANSLENKTRYIQVEVFDYNFTPWIRATWTQVAGECGETDFEPYSATMEYNGNVEGNVTSGRLQMDMYICGPWGDYELEVEVKSTNDGNAMKRVAWEIEYGGDEYHIWDTLNTPFFGRAGDEFPRNGALPSDLPYTPIPNEYSGEGEGTLYKWPLPGSEAYYSLMYTGPFPPLECPNLHPEGVEYVGCFEQDQPDWTTPTSPGGPTGSDNDADPAERYRMFDGLNGDNDDGVGEEGVMTLEKCAGICDGYAYFGLQNAIQCTCGNVIEGEPTPNCGLVDDNVIPEYKYLCSGDSRVLCGTEAMVSIYYLEGGVSAPSPTPAPVDVGTPAPVDVGTPAPVGGNSYASLGCFADNQPDASGEKTRIMTREASSSDMTAEVCFEACNDGTNTHFGTQFGSECWCTFDPELKSITQFSDVDLTCNRNCKGDATETCGGFDAMNVYEITDAA